VYLPCKLAFHSATFSAYHAPEGWLINCPCSMPPTLPHTGHGSTPPHLTDSPTGDTTPLTFRASPATVGPLPDAEWGLKKCCACGSHTETPQHIFLHRPCPRSRRRVCSSWRQCHCTSRSPGTGFFRLGLATLSQMFHFPLGPC
jgi:hypothetical protein